jgi:hypothetical protein
MSPAQRIGEAPGRFQGPHFYGLEPWLPPQDSNLCHGIQSSLSASHCVTPKPTQPYESRLRGMAFTP